MSNDTLTLEGIAYEGSPQKTIWTVPADMTDAQVTAAFVRVADAIVVGTLSGATCLDAHSIHFTQSHLTQFTAAYQRFGEALAKRGHGGGRK